MERSQFGKEYQPNRGHREAHISLPEADVRSSVNRIALGTIIGEQPWREMLAADKAKVIDLPPILRARIDLYNSRSHAIDARSPPDVGRLRVVMRQLVPVLRHRQHPHGAERGNHRDIHDDPHGPIPRFTQWENCVSLPGVPGGSGNPAGVAFRQRKHAFVLSDEPILLAKGIVMQASRSPVREHRHSILRHIMR